MRSVQYSSLLSLVTPHGNVAAGSCYRRARSTRALLVGQRGEGSGGDRSIVEVTADEAVGVALSLGRQVYVAEDIWEGARVSIMASPGVGQDNEESESCYVRAIFCLFLRAYCRWRIFVKVMRANRTRAFLF